MAALPAADEVVGNSKIVSFLSLYLQRRKVADSNAFAMLDKHFKNCLKCHKIAPTSRISEPKEKKIARLQVFKMFAILQPSNLTIKKLRTESEQN